MSSPNRRRSSEIDPAVLSIQARRIDKSELSGALLRTSNGLFLSPLSCFFSIFFLGNSHFYELSRLSAFLFSALFATFTSEWSSSSCIPSERRTVLLCGPLIGSFPAMGKEAKKDKRTGNSNNGRFREFKSFPTWTTTPNK